MNQVTNSAEPQDIIPLSILSLALDGAFAAPKPTIIHAIRQNMEIFDFMKRTRLCPDRSHYSIGYVLSQKNWTCSSRLSDWCSDGWCVTLPTSRFLSSNEQCYALSMMKNRSWHGALNNQSTSPTHLIIITDHKPLIKVIVTGLWMGS